MEQPNNVTEASDVAGYRSHGPTIVSSSGPPISLFTHLEIHKDTMGQDRCTGRRGDVNNEVPQQNAIQQEVTPSQELSKQTCISLAVGFHFGNLELRERKNGGF